MTIPEPDAKVNVNGWIFIYKREWQHEASTLWNCIYSICSSGIWSQANATLLI